MSQQVESNDATDDENDNDGDETFDISAPDILDENNFYKLLNVNPNATQEEIRAAYKLKAREFHPDKNTADTTRIFHAVKLAYEVLHDETNRMEYDEDFDVDKDDDVDKIFSTIKDGQMRLHKGASITDIYKEQIDRYLTEYENLSFSNNFNEKLQEIIDRTISISDHATLIDTYVQCNVCQQSCKDLHAHERENCKPYERMFNTVTSSLPFEQIIGSEIWHWKAVERTSVHLPIWNIHEKWNQLSCFISELTEPVRIIRKPERYWTSLIDTYEQNNLEIMKLPILLSQMTLVNYLPDAHEIQNLKAIFDKYDQVRQRNMFSKLKNKDERTESGNYYLFDSTTTNKYIDKNAFCFPITDPPSEISREQCCECQKSFSFLTRHHHCRMCGQQFCADCLMYKRIPHLGFIVKPVRICHKCSNEKEQFIYQHIFTYVKHLIESNQLQYLSIYLALLHQYRTNGNELFYRQTGEEYYQAEKYSLALQCFTYARLSSDEWLKFSNELCKKGEYSYSFTCMKLCEKTNDFWFQQAHLQHDPIYALLCYECIKLSPEQLFEIASQKSSDDMNTCLLYLLYLSIKYASQVNWKAFGEQILLKTKYDGSLAMFCFHLYGKMQKDEWNSIAEQLCQSNALEKLAYFLVYLYHVQQTDFRTSKDDSHIYFMTKVLLSNDTTVSLDDWLNEIYNTSAYDIDRIVIGLSILHLYKYTSWIEYKNQYIERKEYYNALLCHKMAEYLNANKETRWFINAIEDFDPIGYELLNGTNRSSDWKQLGDQYFQNEKFIIALNCYLFCEQNQVDKILIQQAQTPMLSLPIALLYYTVVYKRTQGNHHSKVLSKNNSVLCNETFYNICIVLSKQNNPYVLELVTLAIQMYETSDRFKDIELFKYHLLILNELDKTNDENGKNERWINGGLHILLTFDTLSNESMDNLTSLNQPLLIKTNEKVVNELKSCIFKSSPQFIATLLNPNNYFLTQLKQLFQQCLGRMELSEVKPAEYRAKLYLIEAMIFKLENNPVQTLTSVHNAMLSDPDNLMIFSVVTFINHSHMHSTVRQSLINDIRENSLNLADTNPPTQMKNLHFLERTEDLILLKKYERAIVKRLADDNPVQAAFSYIDSLTGIPDNGFATILTMACLYFYKAMTNLNCTSAELYAYRSIIFMISVEVFLYTRHNVSLYLQMYIYKLLYTVILRSSDLFIKRIEMTTEKKSSSEDQLIINDSYEAVLENLLTNILQLSKVNPLTHAPSTCMAHDMVYMKHAGDKFLKKYLESKKANSTIYQYYYFEGVAKGWIDEKILADERQRCMQNLLDDRNWTMDDVEDILSWPLIPKTDDGWLLNTKHRLQFEQPAYSEVIGMTLNNDTGEIEFMFTQAKKNEHNLLDAADVMDVLTTCTVFSLFTLDSPSVNYHLHPFHEMRYLPKRLSKMPNYLLTLFHADYLLKMISTGVEICSRQPFEIRSAAKNLMQRLPAHIREELQAFSAERSGMITDSIHRFWIQPESIVKYEQAFYKNFFGRTNENITQIYLTADLKMCVKHHDVKYDERDNLINDENETNDNDDQSDEAQFARTFTKYYDEIGQYFPELLRLKELFKLTILSRFIQVKYKIQCDVVSQIENNPELEQFLRGIKQKFGHYLAHSNAFDETILNSLSKALCKQYMCKKTLLKPYIINWLKYDQEQPLLQYLKQSLIQHRTKLKYTIEKLNLFDDDDSDDELRSSDSSKCSWVPAALAIDSNMIIYGGVALEARVKQVSGLKEVQEKSKSIIRIDANKLFANVEKQKSKQKRDNNNIRKGKSLYCGNGRKPPSNEIESGLITHSKTKSEARRNALESSGISPDVKPLWIEEIDMEQKLRDEVVAGLHRSNTIKPKLVLEVYQHSDGYLVCLREDTASSYNVFYEKDSGCEETDQHHYFDKDD